MSEIKQALEACAREIYELHTGPSPDATMCDDDGSRWVADVCSPGQIEAIIEKHLGAFTTYMPKTLFGCPVVPVEKLPDAHIP